MPSAIALVPAKSEDISTLLEMVREYHTYDHLDFDPDLTGSLLKEFIANNSLGRLWMIRESDQSIGYLLLTFGFSLEYKGRDAFIDEFFLNERWRGRGLGKRALALALENAKELGLKAVHLEVERKNTGAKKLYEGIGFEEHDRFLMTHRMGG